MKQSIVKACLLWFATMITLRFGYIRTMRVNGFTTISTWIVSVHSGAYGMGIYAIMLPSSGFSVAHWVQSEIVGQSEVIFRETRNDQGFVSGWGRCKNRASRTSKGTVNRGAIFKWPRCQWDVKHNKSIFIQCSHYTRKRNKTELNSTDLN